jgi:hypothetical protein
MPPCCVNTFPGAPEPARAFTKEEWDAFGRAAGLPAGTYGTCAGDGAECAPAAAEACLSGCRFRDTVVEIDVSRSRGGAD